MMACQLRHLPYIAFIVMAAIRDHDIATEQISEDPDILSVPMGASGSGLPEWQTIDATAMAKLLLDVFVFQNAQA